MEKPIGDAICESEDQDDTRRKVGADDAADDRERGDDSVVGSVDEVRKKMADDSRQSRQDLTCSR